jgi:hypothetical protein
MKARIPTYQTIPVTRLLQLGKESCLRTTSRQGERRFDECDTVESSQIDDEFFYPSRSAPERVGDVGTAEQCIGDLAQAARYGFFTGDPPVNGVNRFLPGVEVHILFSGDHGIPSIAGYHSKQ